MVSMYSIVSNNVLLMENQRLGKITQLLLITKGR